MNKTTIPQQLKHRFIYYLFLSFIIMLGIASCTKTEYLEYEKETLTRILEYRVTNSPQELYGAIDQENNTITLYIPFYLGIEYLNAEIKLDEGATLLDSEGNEINLDGGLDPIPLGDTVKYTVKSITGLERVYTLIQKIQPHQTPLSVKISGLAEDATILEKPANSKIVLLGNFESTSRNAHFIFTDRATGKSYDNFASVFSVTPGDTYNMVVDISADALAGEYDVKFTHQGRTTNLDVPIKIFYQVSPNGVGIFSSSTRYAPGDTIVFNALQGATAGYPNGDVNATVFEGLNRIYVKIHKATSAVTLVSGEALPDELYDTPIPMEIASYSRTQIKAIIPDLPPGGYLTIVSYPNPYGLNIGFAFYADFEEQSSLGEGVYLGRGASISPGFTILPKN